MSLAKSQTRQMTTLNKVSLSLGFKGVAKNFSVCKAIKMAHQAVAESPSSMKNPCVEQAL